MDGWSRTFQRTQLILGNALCAEDRGRGQRYWNCKSEWLEGCNSQSTACRHARLRSWGKILDNKEYSTAAQREAGVARTVLSQPRMSPRTLHLPCRPLISDMSPGGVCTAYSSTVLGWKRRWEPLQLARGERTLSRILWKQRKEVFGEEMINSIKTWWLT